MFIALSNAGKAYADWLSFPSSISLSKYFCAKNTYVNTMDRDRNRERNKSDPSLKPLFLCLPCDQGDVIPPVQSAPPNYRNPSMVGRMLGISPSLIADSTRVLRAYAADPDDTVSRLSTDDMLNDEKVFFF